MRKSRAEMCCNKRVLHLCHILEKSAKLKSKTKISIRPFNWSHSLKMLIAICILIFRANDVKAQTDQDIAIRQAQTGEYEKAGLYFLKEYNNAVRMKDTFRIIQSSRFLGNVFSLVEDSLNSHKYFKISVAYAKEYKDSYLYFLSLTALSYYYSSLDQPHKAIHYLNIVIDLIQKDDNVKIREDTLTIGVAYTNLGAAYDILEDYPRALKNYLISAEYCNKFEKPVAELSTLYRNIGHCYTEMGDPEKGLVYLQEALNVAVEHNRVNDIRFCLDILYKWHKKRGNYDVAIEYLEKYTVLKDTMFNASIIRSIEEMNTRFEADRLKGEISDLSIKNKKSTDTIESFSLWILGLIIIVILIGFVFVAFILSQRYKSKNRKLAFEKNQAELKKRILTAQMNPHFLFNSLNSIQRMYLEGNTAEAGGFMSDFGTLLRKVLQYSELDRIPLSEDLEVLRMYLGLEKRRSDTDFQFEIDMDGGIDPSFLRVPPMIVQPFVENAIWHGIMPIKEQGMIRLKYVLKNNYLECTVTDNGVGYENSQQQRKKGHISKGVHITRERLAGLPNAITITQMGERGTQVIIKIPLTA